MPVKKKVTLEQIYAKLESHDSHFEKHDRQFDAVFKHLFRLEDSLKAEISSEIAKVMDRIRKLEANVEKQTGDLEKLQQEYFALTQSVKRIAKSLETRPTRKRSGDIELSDVLTRLKRIERHLGLTHVLSGADQ